MRKPRSVRVSRGPLRAVRGRAKALPWVFLALLALAFLLGIAFAGSSDRIAAGVEVAGVRVSGLTRAEAQAKLSKRAAAVATVPVAFTAGGKRWSLTADALDVDVNWGATLAEAESAGDWPFPIRGLKRIAVRLLGAEVAPRAEFYDAGLAYELDRIAAEVGRPSRNASLRLDGTRPRVVPAEEGRRLDRDAAGATIVATLAGFERKPVALPLSVDGPDVTTGELGPVAEQVRRALSGPVRFGWDDIHWLVQPTQLAQLLELPENGETKLEIGGSYATLYFKRLSRAVNHPPRNAGFAVRADRSVRIVRGRAGRLLDAPATAAALLEAALSTDARRAELVIPKAEPAFSTADAKALGVTRELVRYSTYYTGTADRIRNLQIAVSLLSGTRIAPGATFSFNKEVGPRTEARGFRVAPVIVGGEYEEGVGGGVSQVATTIFNAAWEGGFKITSRTAHALYISRYPLGRDATVNYPDLDLTFVNDTKRWLVMKAVSTDTGISISLLGAPTGRRVVSEAGPLEVIGPPKVKREPDPGLFVGERMIEDYGEPARAVTVKRIVYVGGRVLYEESWRTAYQSEVRIVRVGTIPVPTPEPVPTQPQEEEEPAPTPTETNPTPTQTTPTTPTTTPTTTTTTTTTTTQTGTTPTTTGDG